MAKEDINTLFAELLTTDEGPFAQSSLGAKLE